MEATTRWLLPEGISEALPAEAARLEYLRRRLLDLYACWGYEMVIPPLIEYLESLLTGTGADLDLQTFKIIDQMNGRLLGIRADMTPQVARIEAHRLKREQPVRLCYLGIVLHTRPDGFARSRAPLQIGAELYGHAGIESDIEILNLMLETLRETGIRDFQIDLGHAQIYRCLVEQAGLKPEQEQLLFDAMQRKALPELHQMLAQWHIATAQLFIDLVNLNGDSRILEQARVQLACAPPAVHKALADLDKIIAGVDSPVLHVDLAELRGFGYHTGAIFAAYVPEHGEAIAQGGRYDHIGEVFGRARPATGFSVDLKTLVMLNPQPAPPMNAIFAPANPDPLLAATVRTLRAQGQQVICGLPGNYHSAAAMNCTAELIPLNGQWVVQSAQR
jgi:ATP phosphoribosyltransferase regulatory subunit